MPDREIKREKKKHWTTYNTTADSASFVRGDQEDWKTNSLTRLRTVSARPAKDQRWVEGVSSSWEDDMRRRWKGGRGTGRQGGEAEEQRAR